MVTTDKVSYYHMLKLETMPQKKKKKKPWNRNIGPVWFTPNSKLNSQIPFLIT